ncbi:cobyrinic acid ac-diamide synthase [Halorubrum aidingense JCM 13560]|uniref:Cobyrinic acid ac-diamide synthase n=1 Tax=Halorubrum aidingense JCM 13560 TaxID=1230454 RepID=M0P604_9EURY|nr:P-loop NTPase [Halorubrum aidingense]EMA65268.1 cobyrinic acid ac-diamide synthase [Halorubrum aidingense JCM 13560]
MATVYAVASAKGGVGKTTTTAAIATILAESGADVVAIDADIGMANLAGAVGVTPGETTIHDVLAGTADPLDAVHGGPVGLRVVPGAADLDAYAAADPSGLKDVVAAVSDADYVFIDAGAGLSHDSTLPLGIADETLLVSTAERSSLGDTEKTRQLTERLGGTVAGAAITRVSGDGEGDDDLASELLDATVLGRIPEDESVVSASDATEPLPLFAPDSPATRAYRDLTRALTGADVAGDGLGERDVVDTGEGDSADESENEDRESECGDDNETESGDRESDEGDETDESNESNGSNEPDEDIIVADSEQAGLGEPGGEEDIIVADEAAVPAGEEADETVESADSDGPDESDEPDEPDGSDRSDEPDDPGSSDGDETEAIDDEAEVVGEGHVSGDDLEAMIEEDVDDDFDDGGEDDPIADADEVAARRDAEVGDAVDESEHGETEDSGGDDSETKESDGDDIDDELAGSVPFRDDDTGIMNTARSESDDESDGQSADEATDDENKGGFFSRLLGR